MARSCKGVMFPPQAQAQKLEHRYTHVQVSCMSAANTQIKPSSEVSDNLATIHHPSHAPERGSSCEQSYNIYVLGPLIRSS